MTELANRFAKPTPLQERALQQAARELLLAQSSDWPFILRTGTSPDYATKRVKDHLHRFLTLYQQLTAKKIDEPSLRQVEQMDNIFPKLNYRLWAHDPL
jgi:1,4-alpha-glucan branching enzyme